MGRDKKKWVSGETSDEKFEAIAKNLEKFSRRLKTTATMAVMPFPVSHYVPEVPADGVIFRYIFVGAGKLLKAVIDVVEKSGDSAKFKASLIIGDQTFEQSLNVVSQSTFDLDADVEAGTKLSVKCLDAEAKGIHIGLLWAPSANNYDISKYLLEEIDKDQQEVLDA